MMFLYQLAQDRPHNVLHFLVFKKIVWRCPLTILPVILHAVSIPAMNLIIRIMKEKKVVRMKSMWEWHASIMERSTEWSDVGAISAFYMWCPQRSTEWSDVGAISAFYMSDSYYSILTRAS